MRRPIVNADLCFATKQCTGAVRACAHRTHWYTRARIHREELENYINSQKAPTEAPSRDQLIMLATSAAVPFIGFGFMDNAIMIVAGEVSPSTPFPPAVCCWEAELPS
jgi:hypothetical protein